MAQASKIARVSPLQRIPDVGPEECARRLTALFAK